MLQAMYPLLRLLRRYQLLGCALRVRRNPNVEAAQSYVLQQVVLGATSRVLLLTNLLRWTLCFKIVSECILYYMHSTPSLSSSEQAEQSASQ